VRALHKLLIVVLLALSGGFGGPSFEASTKVFRWQDEGGDIIPRILPTLSLTLPIKNRFSITPGTQVLGYGHQFGNLSLKISTVGESGGSFEVVHNLFDEFPSNGFRERDVGFDPEHFMMGSGGFISFYRIGIFSETPYASLRVDVENCGEDISPFAKVRVEYAAYLRGFFGGFDAEVFLKTISSPWVRYHLAGKTFDVNILESPVYINLGYRKSVGGVEVMGMTSFLVSQDVGPKLGPCGPGNVCRDGATDGFSPIYSKVKFQGSIKIPFQIE